MDYEIDESIMGGLQMYTESEFMDMSLASRVLRINQEIEKLVNWFPQPFTVGNPQVEK